ncbi:uncharacterized protein MELLADRAFT_85821 [Melampsora larici-populina 98AG31]|uniref:DUF7872 domain-containing protein n=1 Tax=Melampsora larici-populina (strain 98AG31 / pathotype 3-4-7) TaxID=747676 RepID=F4RJW6_MELLP|nr:uncharacterized protein MELLADRAFT_85821 [Melampsora larici-populina 98AG31]EGG07425.1 hypothetical protein MELLADRAFT_85821 [Melampsora larici-populina 98AG31]
MPQPLTSSFLLFLSLSSTSKCLTTPPEPVADLPPVYSTTSFTPPVQQHLSTNSNSSSIMMPMLSETSHQFIDDADQDPCRPRTLSPELWSELGLNRYLLNYPGGREICLEQLAIKSRLLNFDCGIDKMCYAGQLCSPVRGKDWYLLVAAQEWNSFMNIIYRAIGFAMTMMQGIIPSMISDFFPDENDDWAIAKAYLTLFSNIAKVHPTEGHISLTKWWMQLIQGQVGFSAGVANVMDYSIVPDPTNQHDKWTYFIYQLSKNQDLIQSQLTKSSEEIVSSGISTEEGIYGALKDGAFLIDHVHYRNFIDFAANEQNEMKLSIELHLLSSIWEKQKFFITRGSHTCDQSGPNGAFDLEDELSYCGPDNIMMNIVRVGSSDRLVKKIHNGRLVLEKYNFTTGFLTERAWKCQEENHEFEFDVWNSSRPIRLDAKCSFNLPVCDLTRPEI